MANTTPKPTGEMAGDAPIVTAGDPANATPGPAGPVFGADVNEKDLEGRRPPMKELTGVKYSGVADRKIFTTADLEKLGAENAQTNLEWSADNGFVVPITDLNASTVDALIKLPGFTAV